jgi:hypothetical protein
MLGKYVVETPLVTIAQVGGAKMVPSSQFRPTHSRLRLAAVTGTGGKGSFVLLSRHLQRKRPQKRMKREWSWQNSREPYHICSQCGFRDVFNNDVKSLEGSLQGS